MSKSPEEKLGWITGDGPSYLRDPNLAFDGAQHPKVCQVAVTHDIDAGKYKQATASCIDLTPEESSPPFLVLVNQELFPLIKVQPLQPLLVVLGWLIPSFTHS
jgi:hypothetical protein